MPNNAIVDHPKSLLKVRIFDHKLKPSLTAVCAGYDCGKWRDNELVEHVMEWLPEFALKYSELQSLGPKNALRLIRKAAKSIYNTEKYKKRGEFGELFLHIILRQVFGTIPAISKMHYKDSRNDTVKGFDSVHVIATKENLELWLGEVKFYKDISSAIHDVVKELRDHTERDYLRDEFVAITNKIDEKWPYAEKLHLLLDNNTPLDQIFDSAAIPVLLTYDSQVINSHKKITDEFQTEFEKEMQVNWTKFSEKDIPDCIDIHLLLLPLKSKDDLQKKLHTELQKWN